MDKEITLISELIQRLSKMMWTLMCDGIWMRGGCAIGLLSNTSHSPWGPAFIEAYETETRLAIHPRLVFSRSVYDWIARNTDVDQLPIKRDANDGVYFIDVIGSGISRLRGNPRAVDEFRKINEHLNFGHTRLLIIQVFLGNIVGCVENGIGHSVVNNKTFRWTLIVTIPKPANNLLVTLVFQHCRGPNVRLGDVCDFAFGA